jgi:hypothetical protein
MLIKTFIYVVHAAARSNLFRPIQEIFQSQPKIILNLRLRSFNFLHFILYKFFVSKFFAKFSRT